MQSSSPITIALVDDHTLFREGLVNLLREYDDLRVVFSASNGMDLQEKLLQFEVPQVILMDINMPQLDGNDTTTWIKANHPAVHVLALSMYEDDLNVIKMLRNGAGGYIVKESRTDDLVKGIRGIVEQGYYINEIVSEHMLLHLRDKGLIGMDLPLFSDRELTFLEWCCSELTYKEIADRMHVSPRTVDNYRESLFEKLGLRSRTGMVLYAIKKGIVQLNSIAL